MKNPHFMSILIHEIEFLEQMENFTYNMQLSFWSQNFTHVVCLNALIPKSYYLIQNGPEENKFQLQENDTIIDIRVPLGNYNLPSFKKVISNN